MQFNTSTRSILPIAAIMGIIALAAMGINFKTGLILFGLDVGLLILFATRKKSTSHIPEMKIVSSQFEITESPHGAPVSASLPKPVQPTFYQPLLASLRSSGHSLQAPVIYTSGDPVTAEEIVIEIARVMQEKGVNIMAMAPHMPAMYNMIWDYADQATKRYSDLELIKIHIASSVYFKFQLEHANL